MGPLAFALILAAEPSSAAPAPPDACRAAYQKLGSGLQGELQSANWAKLESDLDAIEAPCEHRPILQALRTMRAEMQLRRGQPAKTLELLDANPVTASPSLKSYARWIRLGALEALGRQTELAAQRNDMVRQNDEALADPRGAGAGLRKVEQFETPLAIVQAWEGSAQQGPFTRLLIFTANPKGPGMPATLTLTTDPSAQLLGEKGEVYFIDLYACASQSLMSQIEGKKGKAAPDYAAIKARAVTVFSQPWPFALKAPADPPRICAFPEFILPGLVPPPSAP
jgi:hypothetical protein